MSDDRHVFRFSLLGLEAKGYGLLILIFFMVIGVWLIAKEPSLLVDLAVLAVEATVGN